MPVISLVAVGATQRHKRHELRLLQEIEIAALSLDRLPRYRDVDDMEIAA